MASNDQIIFRRIRGRVVPLRLRKGSDLDKSVKRTLNAADRGGKVGALTGGIVSAFALRKSPMSLAKAAGITFWAAAGGSFGQFIGYNVQRSRDFRRLSQKYGRDPRKLNDLKTLKRLGLERVK